MNGRYSEDTQSVREAVKGCGIVDRTVSQAPEGTLDPSEPPLLKAIRSGKMASKKELGRFLPNLVLIRDMGIEDHVEFRVQCEVWLEEEADIQAVEKALIMKTSPEL